MSSERERQLQAEIDRLKSEQTRKDDDRWDMVKEHYAACEENWKAVRKEVEEVKRDTHRINISLNGTPDEPAKGMKVRVDRLEQQEKNRNWFNRAVGGTVVALAVKAIWNLIKGS